MQVASFDLLPVEKFLTEAVTVTPRDPINANYEALGFESMYTLMNLGTMLLLFSMYPVLILFELSLRVLKCKYPRKLHLKISKPLYWNSSINFFRESYLVALMCVLINLKALSFDTLGEKASSYLTLLIMALWIAIPGLLVFAIFRNFSRLRF